MNETNFLAQAEQYGIRVLPVEEWTVQRALDMIREQRRRYANNPQIVAESGLAAQLAAEIARHDSGTPSGAVVALTCAASAMGALLLQGLPPECLPNVLGMAADDLSKRATSGEQS